MHSCGCFGKGLSTEDGHWTRLLPVQHAAWDVDEDGSLDLVGRNINGTISWRRIPTGQAMKGHKTLWTAIPTIAVDLLHNWVVTDGKDGSELLEFGSNGNITTRRRLPFGSAPRRLANGSVVMLRGDAQVSEAGLPLCADRPQDPQPWRLERRWEHGCHLLQNLRRMCIQLHVRLGRVKTGNTRRRYRNQTRCRVSWLKPLLKSSPPSGGAVVLNDPVVVEPRVVG